MNNNSHNELIQGLKLLEDIKSFSIIQNQKSLLTGVTNLQIEFSKTLTDCLTMIPNGLTIDEIALARENKTLEAVKLIRNRTNIPMNQCKEMVITWQKEQGLDPFGGQR